LARHKDLYLTTHNTDKRRSSMPPAKLEPTTSGSEEAQTHNLQRAGTGIGHMDYHLRYFGSSIIFLTTESLFFLIIFIETLPLSGYITLRSVLCGHRVLSC
jgi:hypothetical protein